jgi:hypothetical protein
MPEPLRPHAGRVAFGRRLEPAEDVVLHGAGQDPYISWDWGEHSPVWRDWGHARVWANATILEHYRNELADPLFRHTVVDMPAGPLS